MGRTLSLSLSIVTLLAWGCGPDAACTAAELRTALAAATAGSLVEVGECEIEGSFEVPAGVTLRGAGAGSVLRSGASDAPVLSIGAGAGETRVESLSIVVEGGGLGVRAVETGALVLEALDVDVVRGAGVGRAGGTLAIRETTLRGPITAENALSVPTDPMLTGVWGLVTRDAEVSLTDVYATGLAVGAIAIEGGTLTWADTDDAADIDASRGVGLALFGATATVTGVELGGMLAGSGLPGVVIAARDGAAGSSTLTLTDAVIEGGAGYGLVTEETAIALDRVTLAELGLVGLQAQGGTVTATDLTVRDNGGAGLAFLDTTQVSLERATVSGQRRVSLPVDVGAAPFADGVHVRRTSAASPPVDLVLRDVVLSENPRAGFLLDSADGAPTQLLLMAVEVSSIDADALGVVAQRTLLPPSWDAGVARAGTPAVNDLAFSTEIDVVGLVMPPAAPLPTF